ncbi:MAG: phosphate/phosphite/phosphonate ABC transporter substrate-binding protein [Cyclobacteriaceae bacterium]|nr:phosphate/phosphite/phosphonate ABC transporter substrate-binding protein [Cyclobacteriaceae bacterium]
MNESLNQPTKIVLAKDVLSLVDLISEGKVDFAHINPFGYVLSSISSSVDVLVNRGNKFSQTPETYTSVIFVNAQSGVSTIEELKKKASNFDMNYVHVGSTSGHLLPRFFLNAQAMQSEYVFNDVVFSGTHKDNIETVLNKTNTIGAAAGSYLRDYLEKFPENKEDILILWESEPIPHGPVIYNTSLPKSLVERVRNAYLSAPQNTELWEAFQKQWSNSEEVFIVGSDKDFDGIRRVNDNSEDIIFMLNFYRED